MKRSTCAAMVLVCILSFDYDGIVLLDLFDDAAIVVGTLGR